MLGVGMWPKLGQSDCLAKPWNVLCSGGGLGRAAPAALFSSCHCDHSCCLLFPSNLSFCSSSVCSENFPLFSVQFSSVQLLSRVRLFTTSWISTPDLPVHHQLPESTQTHVHWVGDAIQPSHPLLSPSPPALNLSQHQTLSYESALRIGWPKYWSFSFKISPTNEHPGLISFRMDWLDLLAVQGTLKSLLQYHSSRASILRRSAFFIVQLSHPPWPLEKPCFTYLK